MAGLGEPDPVSMLSDQDQTLQKDLLSESQTKDNADTTPGQDNLRPKDDNPPPNMDPLSHGLSIEVNDQNTGNVHRDQSDQGFTPESEKLEKDSNTLNKDTEKKTDIQNLDSKDTSAVMELPNQAHTTLQDSGELGSFVQSYKVSDRIKKFTEKGFQYTLDLYLKEFRNAVANHTRCVNVCRGMLNTSQWDISTLTNTRNKLESLVVSVSNAFHKVVELSPDQYEPLIERVTECESTNRVLLHDITEALRSADTFSLPRSHNDEDVKSKSNRSKSHSSRSKSSHSSSHSSRSGRSNRTAASLKAEAAVKAASLRAKLKYIEAENEQKLKLDKLQTLRDLEIEEAKISALDNLHLPSQSQSSPLNDLIDSKCLDSHGSLQKCETSQPTEVQNKPISTIHNLSSAVNAKVVHSHTNPIVVPTVISQANKASVYDTFRSQAENFIPGYNTQSQMSHVYSAPSFGTELNYSAPIFVPQTHISEFHSHNVH